MISFVLLGLNIYTFGLMWELGIKNKEEFLASQVLLLQ